MMEPKLFTAEVLEAAVKAATPRPDWYIVLAHHCSGWWKFKPNDANTEYATERDATVAIMGLPHCWTHARIVRVPGEEMVRK